jgi:hypothetical protein
MLLLAIASGNRRHTNKTGPQIGLVLLLSHIKMDGTVMAHEMTPGVLLL